jgi:hypothetical protein
LIPLSNRYRSELSETLDYEQIASIIPEGPCAVKSITVSTYFLQGEAGTVATLVYGLTNLAIMRFATLEKLRQALVPTEIIAPFLNFTFDKTSQLERIVS